MNWVIARITLRQLLSRRRTLLLLALSAIVILVALLRRFSATGLDAKFTADLLSTLGIGTLMPLVALIFGTGAIGAELEEGTAVYFLAKPVRRSVILATKLLVAIGCSVALTSIPILAAGQEFDLSAAQPSQAVPGPNPCLRSQSRISTCCSLRSLNTRKNFSRFTLYSASRRVGCCSGGSNKDRHRRAVGSSCRRREKPSLIQTSSKTLAREGIPESRQIFC